MSQTLTRCLWEFSRAECHRLFPKDASPLYKQRFAELLDVINQLDMDPALSIEQRQLALKPKIDALPVLDKDPTGLRVDLSLEDTQSGEHKLIDVTVAHTTYMLQKSSVPPSNATPPIYLLLISAFRTHWYRTQAPLYLLKRRKR